MVKKETEQILTLLSYFDFQSEDPKIMMESTNLVTELISILIRKHELLFPQTDEEDLAAQRHNAG